MRNYLQAYLDVAGSGLIKESVVQKYIEQQTTIDKILPESASFFYIVESPSRKYHFMGKQQETVSGYSNFEFFDQGVELFLHSLHPDEIDIILGQVFPYAMSLVHKAADKDKKKLLLQYNYRFRRKTGEYINLLEQVYVLEVDKEGKASLLLGNIIVLSNDNILPVQFSAKIFRQNSISETLFSKTYTTTQQPFKTITKREMDILRNLAAGKTSREIGQELYISHHTVDTHRRNLLRKLQCKSVVDLARYAFKNGLL